MKPSPEPDPEQIGYSLCLRIQYIQSVLSQQSSKLFSIKSIRSGNLEPIDEVLRRSEPYKWLRRESLKCFIDNYGPRIDYLAVVLKCTHDGAIVVSPAFFQCDNVIRNGV